MTVPQRSTPAPSDGEIVAAFRRLRDGRTDTISEEVLALAARQIGVDVARLRDAMLRDWGIIE